MSSSLTHDATSEPAFTLHAKDGATMELQLPSPNSTRNLAHVFKLLSDETRLRILYLLRQTRELNVLELCRQLQQRQPSVSHHLALLRDAGVVCMRRDGKHNFYRICQDRVDQVTLATRDLAP